MGRHGGQAWGFSAIALLFLPALVATGCGGSSGDASAAEGTPVVYVTSTRDPSDNFNRIASRCNAEAKGRYRIEPVMLPATVDGQREQMIRRLAGQDPDLDILGLDVINTAEFSAAGWLLDLTKRVEPETDKYMPAAVETVRYDDRIWAVPSLTGIAVLYYRTDLVKQPPKTWEEVARVSKEVQQKHPKMVGYAWQGNQYEGMTVVALELFHDAGAQVLDEGGEHSMLADGDGAKRAIDYLKSTMETGVSPRQVTTMQEEETRQLFQKGDAVFLRNWPYVYNLANEPDSVVRGKVGVTPLPGFEGGTPASVLGGKNYAISRFSKHPELAWDVIQCINSPKALKDTAIRRGDLPALAALWDDPDIRKAVPHIDAIRKGMETAHPRPVSPYYNDITSAINRYVHEALTGRKTTEQSVEAASRAIELAVQGQAEI